MKQHRATVMDPSMRWARRDSNRQELETKEQLWDTLQLTNGVRARHGEHF
jgi:hypothetical protein